MITVIGNIWTSDGKHQLTAVNGGGLGPNNGVALNTNRTVAGAWETFNLILQPGSPAIGPGMKFALQTSSGKNYLTAVNGGGMGGPNDATSPVHTDQTSAGSGPWEIFVLQVNNNAVPVTAQIMCYNPQASPFFVTAVNGGGIGDGGKNITPVHTDATTIGPLEQFSFTGWVVNTGPVLIVGNTNVNINNPLGGVYGNIAGAYQLTIDSNGNYTFSGNANNSANFSPQNYALAVVVIGADKQAYAFGVQGNIGAPPFGNNNFVWGPQPGNNPAIQAKWDNSLGLGWTVQWTASATVDWNSLLNGLVTGLTTAGTIVGTVIKVVGFLAG
jgi:hypothetical protein